MSFSGDVKEELSKKIGSSRHCQIAELAAIIYAMGYIEVSEEGIPRLYLQNENSQVNRKFFTILKKAFNIDKGIFENEKPNEKHINGRIYHRIEADESLIMQVLMSLRITDETHEIRSLEDGVNPIIVRNSCCKRAFLRDTFLCIGSMSDPNKSYHMEFVCGSLIQAEEIKAMIESFDIESKIIQRKKYYVVYLKEGSGIVDLLNVMEAPVSMMEMENLRIVKDVRNSVNRRVNCEAANITKTVNAATKQVEDITYIRDHYGLDKLQDSLRETAEARLQYPEASLVELGKYLDPPVGKSGVNHRLRKLSEIADKIRF
ncbi:MAG: DNA-binding protein WhiA [Butyrivibrio sp.]|nr:DNA-binding protein WhiA [Butyrivibrio sp.]